MNTLGNKIKDLRKKKGMSQETLAETAKVHLRTVQRIENGESEPRGKTLNLICEVLEVNIEDLLDYGKHTDRNFLMVFHLSVISFLVFPMGNFILPLILWMTKKDKIVGLKEMGAKTLNFQIVWTIATFMAVIAYAFAQIMHYPFRSVFLYTFLGLYAINIILPILLALKAKRGGSAPAYPNLIRIIR